jgi:peptidoglycan/xylan/chitin deacetylase (PgdA/CDA1 family)
VHDDCAWLLERSFFVLGEVAEAHPALVRRIARAGHEIGFHGARHEFLASVGPARFAAELRDWLPRLGELAGAPVCGFRAPYFSLTPASAWALPLLAEQNLNYDASIYPARNDRYGWPGAPRTPARLAGSDLVLFPVPCTLAYRWPSPAAPICASCPGAWCGQGWPGSAAPVSPACSTCIPGKSPRACGATRMFRCV